MATLTGSAGDDVLVGTAGDDDFHLEQGGEDKATGGRGSDIFYMGGAFDAGDRLSGGSGRDFLMLDGDYSSGVALTATTMSGMESIHVAAGHDYVLSGITDANLGTRLTVDGRGLHAGDSLQVEASGADVKMTMFGGAGDDLLVGGQGGDTIHAGGGDDTLVGGACQDAFYFGSGHDLMTGGGGDDEFVDLPGAGFNTGDRVDGGDGNDYLFLNGVYDHAIHMKQHSMAGVENLILEPDNGAGGSIHLTMADGNVAAGQTLLVQSAMYGAEDTLYFDGSREQDGAFDLRQAHAGGGATLIGGAGDDSMYGGQASESLVGGGGDDHIADQSGSVGADTLVGGRGADHFDLYVSQGSAVLVYGSVADSTAKPTWRSSSTATTATSAILCCSARAAKQKAARVAPDGLPSPQAVMRRG